MDYWKNKEDRANAALLHMTHMALVCSEEIKNSVKNTKVYSFMVDVVPESSDSPEVIIEKADSVSAAKEYMDGKTAILNFASYKNPGGMFLKGSSAQEESLCHESFLYNVLREFDNSYYEWNRSHLNRGLYKNRALYTPDVLFGDKFFDVITCAAPNIGAAKRYQDVSNQENRFALRSRMQFIKDIAEDQGVDTLILGAFGCGVFKQDAGEVAKLWKEIFEASTVKKVIHPIPDDKNLIPFMEVFGV